MAERFTVLTDPITLLDGVAVSGRSPSVDAQSSSFNSIFGDIAPGEGATVLAQIVGCRNPEGITQAAALFSQTLATSEAVTGGNYKVALIYDASPHKPTVQTASLADDADAAAVQAAIEALDDVAVDDFEVTGTDISGGFTITADADGAYANTELPFHFEVVNVDLTETSAEDASVVTEWGAAQIGTDPIWIPLGDPFTASGGFEMIVPYPYRALAVDVTVTGDPVESTIKAYHQRSEG